MTRFAFFLVFAVTNILLYQNCQPNQFSTITSSTSSDSAAESFAVPKISLASPLAALMNSRNISINFKVEVDPKTTIKSTTCQLNNLTPTPCTSNLSQAYVNLTDGDYIIKVNAEDMKGQKAAELVASFRIDGTAPIVTITQAPALVSGVATASFVFSAVDGLSSITAECALDNAAFTACTSPVNLSALAEGAHSFKVRATDAAQNISVVAQHSWSINMMAPSLTITANPPANTNVKTANFSFNGQANGVAISQFQCAIDEGTFVACVSPTSYNNLTDGAHKFSLRGADINGTFSTPIMLQWNIDSVMPTVPQITTTTTALTKLTTATFSFSSTDTGGSGVASYQCSLDNAAFATCASPQSFANIQNGSHSFRVKSLDGAGNSSNIATISWLVDNLPPTLAFSQSPPASTTATTATFAFSATDGSGGSGIDKFECSLDNAAFATCTSPQNLTGLAVGSHNFRVRAYDLATNVSSISTATWTVTDVATEWNITPIQLMMGSNGSFDLKTTLPSDVKTGGIFSVDSTGSALPVGMTLSSDGVLSVGTAAATTLSGVVFSYTEP